MRNLLLSSALIAYSLLGMAHASIGLKDDTTPSLDIGAQVFNQRCSLCHGSQGMGEGKIPLKIPDYPDTNLFTAQKASTKEEIYNTVVYGSMLENINQYMPPMGNELTWTELESVSLFIGFLRNEPKQAIAKLSDLDQQSSFITLGKDVFEARCVLCHGKNGLGDGRMAKIIKSPPPFNLTKSRAPAAYLKRIIEEGGQPLGRSPQMPPWGEQLSADELNAVVEYIISLRD